MNNCCLPHPIPVRDRSWSESNPSPMKNNYKAMAGTKPAMPTSTHPATAVDLKAWLKQFDQNGDGISRRELRGAICAANVTWLKGSWTSFWAIHAADANGDGLIDDRELDKLVEYLMTHLARMRI
ncbi:uncharacterized protein LOC116263039 [Nymphaea colorata]|nr:uncharacterized protein LOC116263039 [Nymphaea colorata]